MLTAAISIAGFERESTETVTSFIDENLVICGPRQNKQECLDLIKEISDREGQQNPELRFRLSERLIGMGDYRPENFLLAIDSSWRLIFWRTWYRDIPTTTHIVEC